MNNRRAFLRNTTALGIGSVMIPSSFQVNINQVNEPGIGLFYYPQYLKRILERAWKCYPIWGIKK
jgi:hypothetical protein